MASPPAGQHSTGRRGSSTGAWRRATGPHPCPQRPGLCATRHCKPPQQRPLGGGGHGETSLFREPTAKAAGSSCLSHQQLLSVNPREQFPGPYDRAQGPALPWVSARFTPKTLRETQLRRPSVHESRDGAKASAAPLALNTWLKEAQSHARCLLQEDALTAGLSYTPRGWLPQCPSLRGAVHRFWRTRLGNRLHCLIPEHLHHPERKPQTRQQSLPTPYSRL